MTSPTSSTHRLAPARGSCPTGKVQFATRKSARRYRRKMGSGPVSVYDCPECEFFHLGHLPARVRTGEVDKAEWLRATGRSA